MDFRANYVSASVAGDYYQAMFEAEQDADDPDSTYLSIQREFEDPDDDRSTSKRMTKNMRPFSITQRRFHAAEVVNRARSSEGQFCQRDPCDGGHGVRRSITGGKDH